MKTSELVNHKNQEFNELKGQDLDQISGGAVWATEPCSDCFVVCNNPKCEHYGQYVSASAGPPALNGIGIYHVCDFCGELIGSADGVPTPFQ